MMFDPERCESAGVTVFDLWVPEVVQPYTTEKAAELCKEYIRNVHVGKWDVLTAIARWAQIYSTRIIAVPVRAAFFEPYIRGDDPLRMCCDHVAWCVMQKLRDVKPTTIVFDPNPPHSYNVWRGLTLHFQVRVAIR